jgi:hypothetical protein
MISGQHRASVAPVVKQQAGAGRAVESVFVLLKEMGLPMLT